MLEGLFGGMKMNKWVKQCLYAILFLLFLSLVIFGQKKIGYGGTALMITGLAGLLALLWQYNRKFQ